MVTRERYRRFLVRAAQMNRLRQSEALVMEERCATTMRLPDCMTRWSYACGHKGQANSTHCHSDLEDKQPDLKCGMTSPNSINQIFEDEYRFAMTIKAAKDMVEPFDIMYMGQSRSELRSTLQFSSPAHYMPTPDPGSTKRLEAWRKPSPNRL